MLGHVARASWLRHCPASVALIGMETPGNVAEVFWFDVLVHAGCPGDGGRVGELARFLRLNEFTAVAQLLRAGHPSEWLEAEGLSDAELQFVHQLGTGREEQPRWAHLVTICVQFAWHVVPVPFRSRVRQPTATARVTVCDHLVAQLGLN